MATYKIGELVEVHGYITSEECIRGRSLRDLEAALGFEFGRLAQGVTIVALTQMPGPTQFELAGYSQVAAHRFGPITGLDVGKIKKMVAADFAADGRVPLVKVIPAIAHNPNKSPNEQYPPGGGVRQWKLTSPIPGRVVAVVDGGYPNAIALSAKLGAAL